MIHSTIIELRELDIEIKRLRKRIRELQSRKLYCEKLILEYLQTTEQPGVRLRDTVVTSQIKKNYKRPNKKEKQFRIENILRESGHVHDSNIVQAILEAMKGDENNKEIVKINTI